MLWEKTQTCGRAILIGAVVTACSFTVSQDIDTRRMKRADYHEAIQIGYLANRELNEVSGLASSRLRSDLLWSINDSGSGPFIYATSIQGAHLGKVRISDARNRDWEDLASFRLGDVAYLLIADVGDNEEIRSDYVIYMTREPVINEMNTGVRSIPWEYRIRFVYEDGARDCESVAVDLQSRQILLLSKRDKPPVLYMLPLFTQHEDAVLVARRVAEVDNIPRPTLQDMIEDPRFGRYRSQPTAMDVSPDGSAAVVLTYKNGYLFQRRPKENWARVFKKIPQIIGLPRLRQAEALCFAADGTTLYVTSEKTPAPLLRLDAISAIQSGSPYRQ